MSENEIILENDHGLEIPQGDKSIIFSLDGETPSEVMRISKGKFYWKGQEIDDIHDIYERFNEWLTKAEMTDKNTNNKLAARD